MRFVIYPYKMMSMSAKKLAERIEAIRVWPNKKYKHKNGDVIINWGNSEIPKWKKDNVKIINDPDKVKIASNKIEAFKVFAENEIKSPRFTTNINDAINWGVPVMKRTIITGHSGNGCVYLHDIIGDHNDAKLWTEYIKKTKEYRVHVVNGKVIDVQEKRKRKEIPEDFNVDFKIRSYNNGWVFCREDVKPNKKVLDEAKKAVKALGLNFGAVDVIWNRYKGAYVIEVNTAPGLEGTSIEKYADAFIGEYNA